MARRFAESTKVPVDRTRAELDSLLAKHGASQRGTFADDDKGLAVVQFRIDGRMVRVDLHCPSVLGKHGRELVKVEQLARAAWRRLLLVVKAKLEIVADGMSTHEREFLADILLPDGKRVIEHLSPQLTSAYKSGKMPPLLPPAGGA